jgi:hypothetical protein
MWGRLQQTYWLARLILRILTGYIRATLAVIIALMLVGRSMFKLIVIRILPLPLFRPIAIPSWLPIRERLSFTPPFSQSSTNLFLQVLVHPSVLTLSEDVVPRGIPGIVLVRLLPDV